MKRLSESGIGILEVIIAAAIMVIVALGFTTVMSNMISAQNNIKFRMDGDVLNEEIRAFLSSPGACTNSFGGLAANSSAQHSRGTLYNGATPAVAAYTVGTTYGDRSVTLNAMVLGNYVAGSSPTKAQMTLKNIFEVAKQASGSQQVERTINLSLDLDAANNIVSCVALARMSDGIWQRSAIGSVNNIFFNPPPTGGGVGIGTMEPRQLLHLDSPNRTGIRIGSGGGNSGFVQFYDNLTHTGYGMGRESNNFFLNYDGTENFATVRLITGSPIGDIGIGTLAPATKLQVGYSGDGTVAVANAWNTFSDRRLKSGIQRITNAREIVDELNGYYYHWKNGTDHSRQVGVIAQEVERVLPELVNTGRDGIKTVDYPKLTAVLLEAIKERGQEIENLKKQNAAITAYLCAKDPNFAICSPQGASD